jgi:Collagen triple helix repeat (20 copies)
VTAGQIQQASLVLYVDKVVVEGGIDVATVTSPWGEIGVTFNSKPLIGATLVSNIPTVTQGVYVTLDITSQLQGWVTTPSTNFGVAISAAIAQPNTQIVLDSKENTATSHPAFIDVVLASSGPAGPTGATGPAGANGATGPAGSNGATGPAGSNGATGPAGSNGSNGSNGATGPTGPAGSNGTGASPTGIPVSFAGHTGAAAWNSPTSGAQAVALGGTASVAVPGSCKPSFTIISYS